MDQISIDEWIQEQKGTGWKRIPKTCSFMSWNSAGRDMPMIHTVIEQSLMDEPDVVCEGLLVIDGERVPAYIGFKQWESGPNGIYIEYEAIQWKEK